MAVRLNKTDRKQYDHLMSMLRKAEAKEDWDRAGRITDRLMDFATAMDDKYGIVLPEIGGYAKGTLVKKKYVNPVKIVDNRKKKK